MLSAKAANELMLESVFKQIDDKIRKSALDYKSGCNFTITNENIRNIVIRKLKELGYTIEMISVDQFTIFWSV